MDGRTDGEMEGGVIEYGMIGHEINRIWNKKDV